MPASVLVIEDDPQAARLVARALRSAPGALLVTTTETLEDGLRHLEASPVDCVVLDYRLPDSEGLGALRAIRSVRSHVPVVMMTAAGSEEIAVQAMKLGAADYVVKHGCYADTLPAVVREAIGTRVVSAALASEPHVAIPAPAPDVRARWAAAGLVGESPAFLGAIALAERAAATDATVLLEGETGTGKELFARAIHEHGRRAGRPFLGVNCAAVPEATLESELFGHVRGAFTGADRDHRGLFEEASGGTLFLDEVCETTVTTQAKVLRALQEGEIRPLGSGRTRAVDVRVIAAANRDLQALVSSGRFRLDLYHRLKVFPIRLPPLRERRDDVRLLAVHFLETLAAREHRAPLRLDASALEALEEHTWPGNVRELQNAIHRAVLCAEPHTWITRAMLRLGAPDHRPAIPPARSLKEIVRDVELATISARLREHGYSRAATASSLGLTREGLWQKIRRLGFRPPSREETS